MPEPRPFRVLGLQQIAVGATDKALQAAVDYVARLGGGSVQILPGEYRLRNSVFLPSGVRLLGSGGDSAAQGRQVLSKHRAGSLS